MQQNTHLTSCNSLLQKSPTVSLPQQIIYYIKATNNLCASKARFKLAMPLGNISSKYMYGRNSIKQRGKSHTVEPVSYFCLLPKQTISQTLELLNTPSPTHSLGKAKQGLSFPGHMIKVTKTLSSSKCNDLQARHVLPLLEG